MTTLHMQTTLRLIAIITGFISLLIIQSVAHAQPGSDTTAIVLTYNKTTSVIFPSSIKTVDRGSRDVLAQKAAGIENILFLKAARKYFPETNLTVITEDSTLRQLRIHYSKDPETLVYHVSPSSASIRYAGFKDKINSYQLEQYAHRIFASRPYALPKKTRSGKVTLSLKNIHVRDNILLFQLEVANRSNLSYTIDYTRLFVKDKVQARRTASQEQNIEPILVKGNTREVAGQSRERLIYATDKFTIPRTRHLQIELYEKNGARHLTLKLKHRLLVRARPLL
jgi:conjugative transposon TraN protein